MIKKDINIEKYDIILPNDDGRRYTKRFKQYMYSDLLGKDGIPRWEINNYGCGVCSMATILSSIGLEYDPIDVAKLILMDEYGNSVNFYTNINTGRLGITPLGFMYFLQELKLNNSMIDYRMVKCSYEHPELKKKIVTEMIKDGYMALILVSPRYNEDSPRTFSLYGHYIAVTGVNEKNEEFWIANPNKTGDNQIDITFSYDILQKNMSSSSKQFLMVKRR